MNDSTPSTVVRPVRVRGGASAALCGPLCGRERITGSRTRPCLSGVQNRSARKARHATSRPLKLPTSSSCWPRMVAFRSLGVLPPRTGREAVADVSDDQRGVHQQERPLEAALLTDDGWAGLPPRTPAVVDEGDGENPGLLTPRIGVMDDARRSSVRSGQPPV